MKSITFSSILGLLFLLVLSIAPANAQATRTWVSGVGDDVNPCSRTAPCKTFAGAISKTAPNGEINCLDPGGFGTLTITKGITVDCTGTLGGILAAGVPGFTINPPAGSIVILRNLDIVGSAATPGTHGINIISAAVVHIDNVKITGFAQNGIKVGTLTSGTATVTVTNSLIAENGNPNLATDTGGITIQPAGTANVVAVLNNVRIESNTSGIVAGVPGTGTIKVIVTGSTIFGNDNAGVQANSGTGAVTVFVDRSVVSNNVTGLNSSGPSASIVFNLTTVANNNTGLNHPGGGKIFTFQNNFVVNNTVDGTSTNTLGPT